MKSRPYDRKPKSQTSPYETRLKEQPEMPISYGKDFTICVDDLASSFGATMSGAIDEHVRTIMFGRMSSETTSTREPSAEEIKRRELEQEKRRLRESVSKFFIATEHHLDWNDVVGNDDARHALIEAIESPIKDKALFEYYGAKPTKGVLLSGPPGCGKTMFGKAAASVLARLHGKKPGDVALIAINGPQIQSPFVGVTEQIIRSIFAYARAYKALHGHQLVIFIDEADSILPSRDGVHRRATHWEESNVATFLTEMDGMEDSGALVILATNRPEAIDAALLRDGRCDRKIKVKRPTKVAAHSILCRSLAKAPLAVDETLLTLADYAADRFFDPLQHVLTLTADKRTDYLTLADVVNGAMVVGLVERAKAHAFRRDLTAGGTPTGLSRKDFDSAILEVLQEAKRAAPDFYALQDYVERTGVQKLQIETLAQVKAPNLKELN